MCKCYYVTSIPLSSDTKAIFEVRKFSAIYKQVLLSIFNWHFHQIPYLMYSLERYWKVDPISAQRFKGDMKDTERHR